MKLYLVIVITCLLEILFLGSARPPFVQDEKGIFTGRVAAINAKASLIRLRVQFTNFKFLNQKNRLEFWTDEHYSKRCSATVVGKSNDYLLLKIQAYNDCVHQVGLTQGGHLTLYSDDLLQNIKVADEVMQILLKKKMALESRFKESTKFLDNYQDKKLNILSLYDAQIKKLENDKQGDLYQLKAEQSHVLEEYKNLEARLDEVKRKIELYRVEDQNRMTDRWSLDVKLEQVK